MKRLAIAAMLSIITGLLTSGCMAGIVTDAVTGNPVGDAQVTWVDSHGHSGQTTTDSHGLYVFDASEGDPVPVPGPVDFYVSWDWGFCGGSVGERLVEYDDRPASTPPANPWEIQSLTVQCEPDFERPTIGTATPTNTPAPSATSTPASSFRFRLLPTPTPTPKPGIMIR
jgi:hypothetical protein